MNALFARHAVAACATLLAGCASHVDPPLLSLGARACDAVPSLAGAVTVPFDTTSGVQANLGETSRCIDAQPPGTGKVTYALFRLPEAPAPYVVTVASLANGSSLIAPRLALLDAAGAPGRTLGPDDFQANVDGLRAGLRIRPGERYIVVTADPASLGRKVTLHLSLRDQGGVEIAATVFIPIPVGTAYQPRQAREQTVIYALNGTLTVIAQPIPLVR